jgi:hypothetical protein
MGDFQHHGFLGSVQIALQKFSLVADSHLDAVFLGAD